jgi:hypothetical protein
VRPGVLDDGARSGNVGHGIQWLRPCAKNDMGGSKAGQFLCSRAASQVPLRSVELAWGKWEAGKQ